MIVMHFLLSFISSLDFKPFAPIEANSGSVYYAQEKWFIVWRAPFFHALPISQVHPLREIEHARQPIKKGRYVKYVTKCSYCSLVTDQLY